MGVMRRTVLAACCGLLLGVGALPACSVSPARVEQIRQAWDERDAERARECERAGRRVVAGSCGGGGGP
jgi:hypothetical protein